MVRGYYMATSGILTQSKKLNVISNNLANVSTPGYKSDLLIAGTFGETLIQKTGNLQKSNPVELNSASMALVAHEIHTNHEQGSMENTGRLFDLAIDGSGFFTVETWEGEDVYTRNGSFTLDEEGYLTFMNIGRVQGPEGPLLIGGDDMTINELGEIIVSGENIGPLDIADFEDYSLLTKTGEGVFANEDIVNIIEPTNAKVLTHTLERSNIDTTTALTGMLSAQRSLQSCSEIVKIYDEMLGKAVSEIGRI